MITEYFDKPITLRQAVFLWTLYAVLNSELIAAYVHGWMSN